MIYDLEQHLTSANEEMINTLAKSETKIVNSYTTSQLRSNVQDFFSFCPYQGYIKAIEKRNKIKLLWRH